MSLPPAIFVCIKKRDNLTNGLTFIMVQRTEYFFIQTVGRVLQASGNTFKTLLSVVTRPPGFLKDHYGFIFEKQVRALA